LEAVGVLTPEKPQMKLKSPVALIANSAFLLITISAEAVVAPSVALISLVVEAPEGTGMKTDE
jgi:hypothetical protein